MKTKLSIVTIVFLIVISIFNVISCTKDKSCNGEECCTCSKDSDCKAGLSCLFFSSSTVAFNACGTSSTKCSSIGK